MNLGRVHPHMSCSCCKTTNNGDRVRHQLKGHCRAQTKNLPLKRGRTTMRGHCRAQTKNLPLNISSKNHNDVIEALWNVWIFKCRI